MNNNTNCPSFLDRAKAGYSYYSSINNLPPTYTAGEKGNFPQLVPDPISKDAMQFRFNEYERAKQNFQDVNARHLACTKKN